MCVRLTGGGPFACVANSAANTNWPIDTATNTVMVATVEVGLNRIEVTVTC